MRADAKANHDRLLEVAARAFAREGTGASLKAIAQEAGVGIGTLYRRFPTRETLVEATYRNEVGRICGAVPQLLSELPSTTALREWMDRFVDFMAAKHGMADTLKVVLLSADDLRLETRGLLTDAVSALLAAGIADDSIRSDADAHDVLMALGGITLIAGDAEQRELARRLISLLLDGLAAPAPAHTRG